MVTSSNNMNPLLQKEIDEQSKKFDEKFTYASFTWNGDNATGVKCAKITKRKLKKHLASSQQKTWEVAMEEAKEQKYYELALQAQSIQMFFEDDAVKYGETVLHSKFRAFFKKYIEPTFTNLTQ